VTLAAALRSLNAVLAEPIQDVILRYGDGDLCLEARSPLDSRSISRYPVATSSIGRFGGPGPRDRMTGGPWGVQTASERVLACAAG